MSLMAVEQVHPGFSRGLNFLDASGREWGNIQQETHLRRFLIDENEILYRYCKRGSNRKIFLPALGSTLKQAPRQAHSDEIFILVVDHHGREHALPAIDGWRVMEIIRDWGIDLRATCGGACACAGCHVYVDQPWIDELHPPTAEEEDRLDEAFGVEPSSRLCCQILMSSNLNGLRVRLAPGSELE